MEQKNEKTLFAEEEGQLLKDLNDLKTNTPAPRDEFLNHLTQMALAEQARQQEALASEGERQKQASVRAVAQPGWLDWFLAPSWSGVAASFAVMLTGLWFGYSGAEVVSNLTGIGFFAEADLEADLDSLMLGVSFDEIVGEV